MVYACDFLVMCYHWHGDLFGLTMVLALPCNFLDRHGVVGFPLDCFMVGAHNSLWLWVGTNALESRKQLGLSY